MEIFKAVLSFLILAAALGPTATAWLRNRTPATPVPETTTTIPIPEIAMGIRETNNSIIMNSGMHSPGGCCWSYITEVTRCEYMTEYVHRADGCPMSAVVFTTREGFEVCASPDSETVKQCMKDLDSVRKPGKGSVEEKLQ